MNKNTFQKTALAALVAALSLGMVGTASAADRHDDRHDNRYDRRANDRHDNDHDRWGNRLDTRRGYGADHRYYVGRNLPRDVHQRYYVVDDWRGHQLRQPPRGYHWVQSGSDYLLVAVATGLIASAILGGN